MPPRKPEEPSDPWKTTNQAMLLGATQRPRSGKRPVANSLQLAAVYNEPVITTSQAAHRDPGSPQRSKPVKRDGTLGKEPLPGYADLKSTKQASFSPPTSLEKVRPIRPEGSGIQFGTYEADKRSVAAMSYAAPGHVERRQPIRHHESEQMIGDKASEHLFTTTAQASFAVPVNVARVAPVKPGHGTSVSLADGSAESSQPMRSVAAVSFADPGRQQRAVPKVMRPHSRLLGNNPQLKQFDTESRSSYSGVAGERALPQRPKNSGLQLA